MGSILGVLVSAVFLATTFGEFAIAQVSDEQGHLDGVVRNSTTGAPVRNAKIALASLTAGGPTYSASSDAEGKFIADEIAPGKYRLSAERPGYLAAVYRVRGSAAIGVDPKQKITDIRIDLTPYSVIAGRLVDEFGEPITQVRVVALRFVRSNGQRWLRSAGVPAAVDDRGNFRLANLPPGQYILKAVPDLAFRTKTSSDPYLPTYYPDTVDPAGAMLVSASAGGEANITIRLRSAKTFRIQGKVVDDTSGAAPTNRFFVLLKSSPLRPEFAARSEALVEDGAFSFDQVLPGSYTIEPDSMVSILNRTERFEAKLFGSFPVTITDQSVTGLTIPLRRGAAIEGKIVVEDGEDSGGSQKVKAQPVVRFTSEGTSGFGYSIRPNGDGTFELHDAAPERYRVSVSGLAEGLYLRKIHFGDQDITQDALDLKVGVGGSLTLALSPKAAELSGAVHNDRGEVIVDALVTVAPAKSGPMESFRSAKTDANGEFKFKSLSPGEYRVIAWEDIDPELAADLDFQAHFNEKAATVQLQESSRQQVDLKLVLRPAIITEEAKLR